MIILGNQKTIKLFVDFSNKRGHLRACMITPSASKYYTSLAMTLATNKDPDVTTIRINNVTHKFTKDTARQIWICNELIPKKKSETYGTKYEYDTICTNIEHRNDPYSLAVSKEILQYHIIESIYIRNPAYKGV